MKKQLLLFYFLLFISVIHAQIGKYWTPNDESKYVITINQSASRSSYPKSYKLFKLNIEPLRNELFSIVGKVAKKHSAVISLPNSEGKIEDFEVFEASNFDEELQARFPEIRAYSGKGITDKNATLKLSIAPNGIQTMVFRTGSPNEFIEAYSKDHAVYSVYKSQRDNNKFNWTCSTVEKKIVNDLNKKLINTKKTNTGQLKVLRLAQSCTAEYSNYFGATSAAQVNLVLTAFNNTLARCNGVYEKDFGVHLNIVNQSTNVIYYDPNTDPYSNSASLNNWSYELMVTLSNNANVGNANFDIGHLFGKSGGGGMAGCIGCVCDNTMTFSAHNGVNYPDSYKGSGYTSPADGVPAGDNFDIDFVAHEVGHQLGANHTFTIYGEANDVSNEASSVQVEVGSGITIMSYAGISNSDVVAHSIDKFHAVSIQQVQDNLASLTCPVTTNISPNNAMPTLTITGNSFTIPISTPFALDCSGADANANDALTYSWEQMDSPLTNTAYIADNTASSASATKTAGPNFISFQPTSSSTRYFPRMSSIMNNSSTTGWIITPCNKCDAGMLSESLSSINRTLNFRVTVRDNVPYSSVAPIKVGQTNFADMVVTTNTTGGAFSVSSQNSSGISYNGASNQTITWNPGATATAPFNVANVDILLTYDNGANWIALLSATPNDGNQIVTLPDLLNKQTNCRIMVRSAGTATQKSYFFDVNDVAFTITGKLDKEESVNIQAFQLFPNPANAEITIKFTPKNSNVTIKIHDARGAQVFEQAYVNSNTIFSQNVLMMNVRAGVYFVSVYDGDDKTVKRLVIR